jgi:hypothetical protein
MKAAITLFILAVSSVGMSDVCGIVTKDQAEKSLSLLRPGTRLTMSFNDLGKATVAKVSPKFETTMNGVNYFSLNVTDRVSGKVLQLDPGHTLIVLNSTASISLGRLVGCSPTDSDPDVISNSPLGL